MRRLSRSESIDEPERTYDVRGTARGDEIGDSGQGLVFCAAVGLDQRSRRSAQSSAPDRIRHESQQLLLEVPIGPDLHGGTVCDKRVGNLTKVPHVGSEKNRLPEYGGFQDVVAPVVYEASSDEHRCGQLVESGKFTYRIEHDDVRSGFLIDRQIGAA